jgi:hypothetical protein
MILVDTSLDCTASLWYWEEKLGILLTEVQSFLWGQWIWIFNYLELKGNVFDTEMMEAGPTKVNTKQEMLQGDFISLVPQAKRDVSMTC